MEGVEGNRRSEGEWEGWKEVEEVKGGGWGGRKWKG